MMKWTILKLMVINCICSGQEMKQSQSWFLCPVPGRSPRFMILRFYMKLYEKLVSDFRIIVIEKFGYGCSDLYEGPCDVDSVVAYQRRALENAELVDAAGAIACPILMFISDGKQVSSGWIEHGRAFAELMTAGTIYLNCGHYIHYYESDRISQEITSFVNQAISS